MYDMMYFKTKDKKGEQKKKERKASSSSVAVAVKLKENTLINPREFLGSCSEKL